MAYNILVIDDNKADIRLVEEALNSTNHPVGIKALMDGDIALEHLEHIASLQETKPNLILLDLNMPSIDGFELLKKIKNDKELKRIPIIIFTSSASEEDLKKSYDLHANAYLVKPFKLEVFLAIMTSMLDFWVNYVKTTE